MRQYSRAAARLAGLPGLVTAFRGVRRDGKAWTREQTLTCFVRKKRPRSRIPKDERIPKRLDGIPTDVIAIGRPLLHSDLDVGDLLAPSYGGDRKSSISAWVEHPSGGFVALGSGHGVLPIQNGSYVSGSWTYGDNKRVSILDETVSPGRLWRGAVGNDLDFAIVRFHDLDAPPLTGHLIAGAPIQRAPRDVNGERVVHIAARRGYPIEGRVVGVGISGGSLALRANGIDTTYADLVVVAGDVRFSVRGESGSLVFDEHRRAIGFVVGGGRDPDNPELEVTFVLRNFTQLRSELGHDVFGWFFQ